MFGALYAVLGLLIVPLFYAMLRFNPMPQSPEFPFGGRFLVFMPLLYGAIGFIFTAVGAVIYNLVAKWVGGIEIELTDVAAPVGSGT